MSMIVIPEILASSSLAAGLGLLALTPSTLAPPPGLDVILPGGVFPLVTNLLGALALLLVGWLVAGLLSKTVRGLLRRVNVDERISGVAGGTVSPGVRVDRLAGTIAFWVVMVLAIVAALNVLNLTTVSEPLNQFLNQIFAFLPKLGAAALLAALGWLVAAIAKGSLLRVARGLALDERLFDGNQDDAPAGVVVSETLANVVFWLVLLFFLPLVLNALNLGSQVTPIVNLFDTFFVGFASLV